MPSTYLVYSTTGATQLMAALMHSIPDTRETEAASNHDSTRVCEAGDCSLQVALEKLFPKTCGHQSQQNWASLHGRVLSGLAGTPPAARTTVGAADLFVDNFVVPPHCAARRWTMHENPLLRMSPSSWSWKWCCWMEKVVSKVQTEDKEAIVFPSSYRQFRAVFLESVSFTEPSRRHILAQHRTSNERKGPLRMQVARAMAHGPERPAPREKRSSGSRLFGAASSSIAGALLTPPPDPDSLSFRCPDTEVLSTRYIHAVTCNTILSQSWTRFLTTSRFTVFEIESQFASRSCGDSTDSPDIC